MTFRFRVLDGSSFQLRAANRSLRFQDNLSGLILVTGSLLRVADTPGAVAKRCAVSGC